MKKNLLQKGFTLIELLVVIAIIGILAAVVLGSLNDARSGGQNASIKQSIANVRSQAELIYNAGGYSYTAVCSDPRVTNLIKAALTVVNASSSITIGTGTNSTSTPSGRVAVCKSADTQYVAGSPLAGGSGFWCVDSTGASKEVGSLDGATLKCP